MTQAIYGYTVKDADGNAERFFFTAPQKEGKFNTDQMIEIEAKEYTKDNAESYRQKVWIGYKRKDMAEADRKALYARNREFSFFAKLKELTDNADTLLARARGVALDDKKKAEALEPIQALYHSLESALQPRAKAKTPAVKADKMGRFAHLFAR